MSYYKIFRTVAHIQVLVSVNYYYNLNSEFKSMF